jgi:hypothetical protein
MAKKLLLEILRDDETGEAFINIKPHSIDPDWTASLLYMIINRYMHHMPESMQIEFYKETLANFAYLLKDQQGAALMEFEESE